MKQDGGSIMLARCSFQKPKLYKAIINLYQNIPMCYARPVKTQPWFQLRICDHLKNICARKYSFHTCIVPVVLLRAVAEAGKAFSLLRFLSWLRQWGSTWACRVLNDTAPMGWQETERGHTGMATVMMHKVGGSRYDLEQCGNLWDTRKDLAKRRIKIKFRIKGGSIKEVRWMVWIKPCI